MHRAASDHAPLLLSFKKALAYHKKLFRFEHFWFDNDNCLAQIQKAWNIDSHLPSEGMANVFASKLLNTQFVMSTWNWSEFGHLESNWVKKDI